MQIETIFYGQRIIETYLKQKKNIYINRQNKDYLLKIKII